MKPKSLIPWLIALALLGAAAFLYTTNSAKDAELVKLRETSQQAQTLHAELEQLKTTGTPAQIEEIARLQKDNQDLLRLRNEVRQLRDEKQQLARQAQSAQTALVGVQAENERVQAQVQASAQAQAQVIAQALAQQKASSDACLNNLRQLDGAKQQWALENKQAVTAVPTAKDLAPYFKDGVLPACPAGGKYTLNALSAVPTCTLHGHALTQ